MELAGRWALVTGGAKRVGLTIARTLAARGANLVLHYHTSAKEAAAVVQELTGLGVQAVAVGGDLAHTEDVLALARQAEERSGGIALLVNNASNYLRVPFAQLTEAVWDASLDVNLKAPFLLSHHLGLAMKRRGEGCIVNLADWAAERPYASYLPYCVSKAGIVCLTKALAKELAPEVRVLGVAPGPVMPPDDMSDDERQAVVRATPLRRFGSPDDVARCVRFLAEEATFSTGSITYVDGGRLIA